MNRTDTQNPFVEGRYSCLCVEFLRKNQEHVDGGGLMSQAYLYLKISVHKVLYNGLWKGKTFSKEIL